GGIGNAILGSLLLLILSSTIGLPLGISVGVYLSEIGRGRLAGVVRFIVDTLTGIPSIVTGVFVYAIMVLPMKHFSAFAGKMLHRQNHDRVHKYASDDRGNTGERIDNETNHAGQTTPANF